MTVFLFVAACFTVGYILLLLFYFHHWKLSIGQRPQSQWIPFCSVVIAARNEEKAIDRCLRSLLGQPYPKDHLEVLVVDDGSSDRTTEIIRQFEAVHLLHGPSGRQGKKHALTHGINSARGEIIVTTDADCIVSPGWLHAILGGFTDTTQMVTGPVFLTKTNNAFERFQALDIASLAMVTGAGIESGVHHLANGANMAFRKSAFEEVSGFDNHTAIASGDDVFLVQSIAKKFPGGVTYVGDREAVVLTYPQSSIGSFIEQRIRWATKNARLPEKSVFLIWVFIWLTYAINLTVLVATAFVSLPAALWMVGMILLPAAMEYMLLKKIAQRYQLAGLMRGFPVSFLLHYVYVLSIGVMATFSRQYKWKDRKTQ